MWVFGYGSLMWDGWERQFGGSRIDGAILRGYHRAFNKKSVTNWGTTETPGPTLGLEPGEDVLCAGTAFELPDAARPAIERMLEAREGPSFAQRELTVRLPDGRQVEALTLVNDRSKKTYIGAMPRAKRAAMAKAAKGREGSCADYVRNISAKLSDLGISDPEVVEFLAAMDSP